MAATAIPDWRHEARTLISAGFGVRETARKLGQDEDKVKQWAWRNGIVASLKAARAEIVTKLPSVTTAASVLADEIANNGATSRLAVSQIGARTLPYVADLALESPEMALALADQVASTVASQQRANVPGYERSESRGGSAVVNIALLGTSPEQLLVNSASTLPDSTA